MFGSLEEVVVWLFAGPSLKAGVMDTAGSSAITISS